MSERDERETVAGAAAEARYGDAVRALVTTLIPGADDAMVQSVLAEAAPAAADAPGDTAVRGAALLAAAARVPADQADAGGFLRLRPADPARCAQIPAVLAARATGDLSETDEMRLAGHLDRCPGCRAIDRRMTAAVAAFDATVPAAFVPGSLVGAAANGHPGGGPVPADATAPADWRVDGMDELDEEPRASRGPAADAAAAEWVTPVVGDLPANGHAPVAPADDWLLGDRPAVAPFEDGADDWVPDGAATMALTGSAALEGGVIGTPPKPRSRIAGGSLRVLLPAIVVVGGATAAMAAAGVFGGKDGAKPLSAVPAAPVRTAPSVTPATAEPAAAKPAKATHKRPAKHHRKKARKHHAAAKPAAAAAPAAATPVTTPTATAPPVSTAPKVVPKAAPAPKAAPKPKAKATPKPKSTPAPKPTTTTQPAATGPSGSAPSGEPGRQPSTP